MSEHEHRFSGMTLRHSHPDGDKPHGYFGHPEDHPQEVPAAGELYNGAPLAVTWECEDCGWTCSPNPAIPLREAECDNCGGELAEAAN